MIYKPIGLKRIRIGTAWGETASLTSDGAGTRREMEQDGCWTG
jgi:hypothetical protein